MTLVFKLIVALAAALGGTGWQAQKGKVVCVWAKGPGGTATCVCRRV